MANENVEGSGAKSMAGSEKYNGGFVKNAFLTRFLGGVMGGGDSGGSRRSSKSGGSKGPTGNGAFTGQQIDDYNRYLKTHYKLQNKLEKKRHVRGAETDANREVLKNASRDARHIRDKDTVEHARTFGQMANIDLSTNTKRKVINFAATPARQTNAGKGTGAQGTSRQQTSGKGAAAGRVVGAALGGAVTKNPRGVTAGGALGEKVGDAIESKVINRKPAAKKPGTSTRQAKVDSGEYGTVTAEMQKNRKKYNRGEIDQAGNPLSTERYS